jgi:hypothetical protein
VRRGQLLGRIFFNSYHVHVSEYYAPCGFINPYRPNAPLALPRNREAPTIGDLQARRANSLAWPRLQLGNGPPRGSDPSRALSLMTLRGRVDFRASILDHPTTHVPHFSEQIPQPVAAIRSWVAPPHDYRRHLGPMHVWNGAHLFKLRADRMNLFHLWAFGTWRSNGCYFTETGICGQDLIYHLGGYWGYDTRRLHDHAYQFCVAALTINNVKARRCTRFWVDNVR